MCWSPVEPRVARRVSVRGTDPGDVLVEWLSAVILSAAIHGEVYGDVSVDSADAGSASGVVRGEPIDPARHQLRFDVKAATYHDLHYETSDGRRVARVVFDL
jgi:SHS2 domain-containing protein